MRAWLHLVLAPLVALGCSSDDKTQTDGGADAHADIVQTQDVVQNDVTTCGPVDVGSYQPPTLTPPNPPHANKCTTQQVSDYAQCQGAKVNALCKQFADNMPGQACRQCIETQSTDPRWGVIVFTGNRGAFNVEGCVDDALSQVSKEKANSGPGSCGDLLFASYGCQQAACSACTGSAYDTCVTAAAAGGCKSYDTPVESTTGACGALLGDAAPVDSNACFPDASITDTTQRTVDWISRIVSYMCGP